MSGVAITGKTVPLNGGPFPVFEDILGQGSLRTVADITARNAVSANPLFCKEGMLCYVQSTQCYYYLGADLATWTFLAASDALGAQAVWFVDIAAGSDTNTGKTGQPLKTIEELFSRRLNGKTLLQSTTVNVAGGAYGDALVNINWPASVALFGQLLTIVCAVTSSAPITLASVVNTSANVAHGELTTAAGVFVNKARIRSTSGAAVGAICYSTGLHGGATDTFVGRWVKTSDFTNVNIANGTTVVVDTRVVSFKQFSVTVRGLGYVAVQDANILTGGTFSQSGDGNFNGQLIEFLGCDVVGTFYGNASFCGCSNSGPLFFQDASVAAFGHYNQNLITLVNSYAQFSNGLTFDGGRLSLAGRANVLWANAEFVNATATTAISVGFGSQLVTSSQSWGLVGDPQYTIAILVASGGNVVGPASLATAAFTIPSVTNVSIVGHSLIWDALPAGYKAQGAYFSLNINDPATVANLYLTAQAGNIGVTALFPNNPRQGSYKFSVYLAIVTAGSTGVPVVNVTFTDDTNNIQTIAVASLPSLAIGGVGGQVIIETESARMISYSVTGIVTPGPLQYTLRVNCACDSNGG